MFGVGRGMGARKPRSVSGLTPLPVTSGLIMHLRPEVGLFQDTGATTPSVANDDLVKYWVDQSSGSHDASYVSGATKLKTNGLNGFPTVVVTDGDHFNITNAITQRPISWFVVQKPSKSSCWIGSSAQNDGYLYTQANDCYMTPIAIATVPTHTHSIGLNNWFTLHGRADATRIRPGANGSETQTLDANTGSFRLASIFQYSATSEDAAGECAEFIVYDRYITDQELADIVAHLATKYGL